MFFSSWISVDLCHYVIVLSSFFYLNTFLKVCLSSLFAGSIVMLFWYVESVVAKADIPQRVICLSLRARYAAWNFTLFQCFWWVHCVCVCLHVHLCLFCISLTNLRTCTFFGAKSLWIVGLKCLALVQVLFVHSFPDWAEWETHLFCDIINGKNRKLTPWPNLVCTHTTLRLRQLCKDWCKISPFGNFSNFSMNGYRNCPGDGSALMNEWSQPGLWSSGSIV